MIYFFLSCCFCVNYTNSQVFQVYGVYNFFDSHFWGCVSNGYGGAILIEHESSYCNISRCNIYKCVSVGVDNRAGGICILNAFSVSMSFSCFAQCSAPWGASFVIFAHDNPIKINAVYYITEQLSTSEQHGACPGGLDSLVFHNNNCSKTYSPVYAGGFFFLGSPLNPYCRYCQVCDNRIAGFLAVFVQVASIEFSHWNVVNNSISLGNSFLGTLGGWVSFHNRNTQVVLNHFVLIRNNMAGKAIGNPSSSSSMVFNYCVLDNAFDSVFFEKCSMNFCNMDTTTSTSFYIVFSTNLCQGIVSLPYSKSNKYMENVLRSMKVLLLFINPLF